MVSRNLRFKFTLVSYNILSQTLLSDHGYLYTNCNPRDLEWPRRGHKIVSELIHNQADIICLQEVESEHLQSLYRPRLAHYGYECLYKKKTGYKIDGCAIFYKIKLFNLLNYKGVEFNRTDLTYLLDRDNVGIIAVLQPRCNTRSKSSHLVIANTHLIFNPRRCDIKLAQLKFFLSQLEEISFDCYDSDRNEKCHHPTILCGDMNSTPDSQLSKYILKQQQSNSNTVLPPVSASSDQGENLETTPNNSGNNTSCSPSSDLVRELITDLTQLEVGQSQRLVTDDKSQQKIGQESSTTTVADEDSSDTKVLSDSLQSEQSCGSINVGSSNNCFNRSTTSFSHFDHSLHFKSVYPTHNGAGQKYISTFSSDIVDYIFYTPNKLRLESYRELLTREQLEDIGPLPNSDFPSDHLSLEAKFTLR